MGDSSHQGTNFVFVVRRFCLNWAVTAKSGSFKPMCTDQMLDIFSLTFVLDNTAGYPIIAGSD